MSRRLQGERRRRRATLRLRRLATPLGILGDVWPLAIAKGGSSVAGLRNTLRAGGTSMALRVGTVVSLLALACVSCSDEKCTCPRPSGPTSGRATLHEGLFTDQEGHEFMEGFSFSQGKTVRLSPGSSFAEVDFIAGPLINSDGEQFAVFLSDADTIRNFSDVGGGWTEAEGRAAFDALECVPESPFYEILSAAMPYRVLLVKTTDGRFGKLLVVDMVLSGHLDTPDGSSCGSYCGQVTFDWVFQPDGGRCFK